MTTSDPPPITDSPWFWLYLFATAGIVALMLATPKFGPRQAQIENQALARQRAEQIALGETPTGEASRAGETRITLKPLYMAVSGLLVLGWGLLWWSRFRRRGGQAEEAATRSGETSAKPEEVP